MSTAVPATSSVKLEPTCVKKAQVEFEVLRHKLAVPICVRLSFFPGKGGGGGVGLVGSLSVSISVLVCAKFFCLLCLLILGSSIISSGGSIISSVS